jgi:hypothetical protein
MVSVIRLTTHTLLAAPAGKVKYLIHSSFRYSWKYPT